MEGRKKKKKNLTSTKKNCMSNWIVNRIHVLEEKTHHWIFLLLKKHYTLSPTFLSPVWHKSEHLTRAQDLWQHQKNKSLWDSQGYQEPTQELRAHSNFPPERLLVVTAACNLLWQKLSLVFLSMPFKSWCLFSVFHTQFPKTWNARAVKWRARGKRAETGLTRGGSPKHTQQQPCLSVKLEPLKKPQTQVSSRRKETFPSTPAPTGHADTQQQSKALREAIRNSLPWSTSSSQDTAWTPSTESLLPARDCFGTAAVGAW